MNGVVVNMYQSNGMSVSPQFGTLILTRLEYFRTEILLCGHSVQVAGLKTPIGTTMTLTSYDLWSCVDWTLLTSHMESWVRNRRVLLYTTLVHIESHNTEAFCERKVTWILHFSTFVQKYYPQNSSQNSLYTIHFNPQNLVFLTIGNIRVCSVYWGISVS